MSAEMEALLAEAGHPDTSWYRLLKLIEHPEQEVRRALLDNPNLCPTDDEGELKTRLLKELAREFPEEVANHPVFVLHALIEPTDEMGGVVKEVVKRTADVGLIEHVFRMWGPSSGNMRRAVASNPKTPEDLLRTLGNPKTEDDWQVRATVAENPNAPGDTLRTLGNQQTESKWEVRESVASNPNAPEDVLRLLGNEATESEWMVRRGVARNPDAPVDLLRSLGNEATESGGGVRQGVTENPSTPEDLLRILGNEQTESNGWVRFVVAENPRTPEDVLRTLANPATESDEGIRQAAQKALADRGLA